MKNLIDTKLQNKPVNINSFVFARPSISAVTIRFLILLSLQFAALIATKSYDAVFSIASATFGGIAAAGVNFLIFREKPFRLADIIVQGIFIGFLLPQEYPVVVTFFLTFFTLTISRCVFFRNLNCWVNICCVAVLIAWFIGRNFFPQFAITADLIPLKNSSVYLIQNGTFPVYSFDSKITNFLNAKVFSLFKIAIPEGFVSLFWDTQSSIPAFRFNLLTILSSVIIFSDNAFSGIIPALTLFVYGVLIRFFAPMIFGGNFNQGDILLAFLTGGTLFCVVFLIQWYGTVPPFLSGKIVFGITAGVLAFLIMGAGTSPVGTIYVVLLMNFSNIFISTIQESVKEKRQKKSKNAAANVVLRNSEFAKEKTNKKGYDL